MRGVYQHEFLDVDYQARLDVILSTSLSPENVSTYAEDALDETVSLVTEYTEGYSQQPTISGASGRQNEEYATKYWGMRDVNEVLTHLESLDERIKHAELLIGSAVVRSGVVIPPDTRTDVITTHGEGPFEKPNTIERLKTILFVLENGFEVDVSSDQELVISKGTNKPEMMRGESYYVVEVPKLARTMMVCDEEGNATYVFDTTRMQQLGTTTEQLSDSSKLQLQNLLEQHPGLGKRLVYSKKFTENITKLITAIPHDTKVTRERSAPTSYLMPEAPDNVLSTLAIRNTFKVSGIYQIIDEIKDQLGPIATYRFGTQVAVGFDPYQQNKIYDILADRGLIRPKLPEDYATNHHMSKNLGVHVSTINKAIENLAAELGDITTYRSRSVRAPGYSPKQQQIVTDYLISRGVFEHAAPETHLGITGISRQFNIAVPVIKKAIAELGDTLGDTGKYRIGGVAVNGYTPEQQNMIFDWLRGENYMAPKAPEGYVSINKLKDELGINLWSLHKAIKMLGDSLGETAVYRFGSHRTVGYSPEQQWLIADTAKAKDLSAPNAPEGVMPERRLRDVIGCQGQVLKQLIEELSDSLGSIDKYRFGSHTAAGYSREQQQVVIDAYNAKYNKGISLD